MVVWDSYHEGGRLPHSLRIAVVSGVALHIFYFRRSEHHMYGVRYLQAGLSLFAGAVLCHVKFWSFQPRVAFECVLTHDVLLLLVSMQASWRTYCFGTHSKASQVRFGRVLRVSGSALRLKTQMRIRRCWLYTALMVLSCASACPTFRSPIQEASKQCTAKGVPVAKDPGMMRTGHAHRYTPGVTTPGINSIDKFGALHPVTKL